MSTAPPLRTRSAAIPTLTSCRADVARTGCSETFVLVVFSSYEAKERAPYLGETRARIGGATWKRLDRATVEVLVGGKVQGQRYS